MWQYYGPKAISHHIRHKWLVSCLFDHEWARSTRGKSPREDAAQRNGKQSRDQGKARAPLTKNRPVSATSSMAINAIACDAWAGWWFSTIMSFTCWKSKCSNFMIVGMLQARLALKTSRSRSTLPSLKIIQSFHKLSGRKWIMYGRQLSDGGRTDTFHSIRLPFSSSHQPLGRTNRSCSSFIALLTRNTTDCSIDQIVFA